jgi:CheY-like chemotaxis protein
MQRQRILIVDDDCSTQLIMKRMIEGFGYECDTASDGQEAVAAASSTNYMAIMMDLFMPVMNGCDAAVSIKQNKKGPSPAIVGMISIDEPAARRLCADSGMQSVICKPIQRATLGQCLHHMESQVGHDAPTSASALPSHQGPADEKDESNPTSPSGPVANSARSTSSHMRLRRRSSEPLLGMTSACPHRRSSLSSIHPRQP